MEVAANFYRKFLPQLGFVREKHEAAPAGAVAEDFHTFYSAGPNTTSEFFGFTLDKNHVPNNIRIAFWAESREEVDRITELVRAAGAQNVEGPEIVPEYSPAYYASFFEDPDGNKLEICCRENPVVAQ
jgi:catechol 2,3-dioxygenase-like lactoylglutathione lyase family enzyme